MLNVHMNFVLFFHILMRVDVTMWVECVSVKEALESELTSKTKVPLKHRSI